MGFQTEAKHRSVSEAQPFFIQVTKPLITFNAGFDSVGVVIALHQHSKAGSDEQSLEETKP